MVHDSVIKLPLRVGQLRPKGHDPGNHGSKNSRHRCNPCGPSCGFSSVHLPLFQPSCCQFFAIFTINTQSKILPDFFFAKILKFFPSLLHDTHFEKVI